MSANAGHLMTRRETLSSFFFDFFFSHSGMCHGKSALTCGVNKRFDLAGATCARHRLLFETAYVSEQGYDLFLAELLAEGRHLATTIGYGIDQPRVINLFLPL